MEIKKYFVSLGRCFAAAMIIVSPFMFWRMVYEESAEVRYMSTESSQLRRFIEKDNEQCISLEKKLLLSADKNKDNIVTLDELSSLLRSVGYRGMIDTRTQIQLYNPELDGSAIEANYRGFLARTETTQKNEVHGSPDVVYVPKKIATDYLRTLEVHD